MNRSIKVSIGLLLAVVLVGGVVVSHFYEKRVKQEAAGHLRTMLMLRESVLRSYFESLRSEVTLWSSQPIVIDLMKSFQEAYRARGTQGLDDLGATKTNNLEKTPGNRENVTLDVRVAEFAEHHRYYDVFFIGPGGDVLYTVAKEDDFATNLLDGPYSNTGLGRLFRDLHASPGGDRVKWRINRE